jgi:dimethylglycine dehydrogenase
VDAGVLARLHPAETGLDRFIAWKKNADFIGRAASEAERAGPRAPPLRLHRRCGRRRRGGLRADLARRRGRQGFCTSGGYSHMRGQSVALGFLPAELIAEGREVEIEILGEMRPARLVTTPLFDPEGARMRG